MYCERSGAKYSISLRATRKPNPEKGLDIVLLTNFSLLFFSLPRAPLYRPCRPPTPPDPALPFVFMEKKKRVS